MKDTRVLIAENDAENFGRKMMLEAHKYGKMGFEMARLPQHVSLKQPFNIPNLEEMKKYDYKKSFKFSKLGLLYYDDDNIRPGTYFCYKVCDI